LATGVGVATADELDRLLDRFMPTYEIVERRHIRVAAPAINALARAIRARANTAIAAVRNDPPVTASKCV
jgi:hypothetical protein